MEVLRKKIPLEGNFRRREPIYKVCLIHAFEGERCRSRRTDLFSKSSEGFVAPCGFSRLTDIIARFSVCAESPAERGEAVAVQVVEPAPASCRLRSPRL